MTMPSLFDWVPPRNSTDLKCSHCKLWLPRDNFHKSKDGRGGRQARCKPCASKANQRYNSQPEVKAKKKAYRNRPEVRAHKTAYHRNRHLRRTYGLTVEQWESLFDQQDRRCALCLAEHPGTKNEWHTDHDHETGNIRGILCESCNRYLLPGYERLPIERRDSPLLNTYLSEQRS